MRKILVGVISYLLFTTYFAWGQDAIHFYNLGLNSSMTYKKIHYFTKALELDPKLSAAYEKRGTLYYFQEKYTKTLRDFQSLAELKPFEPETYIMLGLAYMKKENYNEAIASLTRATELDAQSADAYSYRAEAHQLKGMAEETIQDATNAIELGVNDQAAGRAYTARAKVYRKLGQSELADLDFKKALSLDPAFYIYTIASSTEFLADSASENSDLKRVSWMGAALIIALLFVVVFKLTFSAPKKNDDN